MLDIAERITEDDVLVRQVIPLPLMLQLALVALQHGEEPEIHRAHVERGEFRLVVLGRLDALGYAHRRGAAGRGRTRRR